MSTNESLEQYMMVIGKLKTKWESKNEEKSMNCNNLQKKTAAKIAELQFGLVAAKKMQSFHELLKKL